MTKLIVAFRNFANAPKKTEDCVTPEVKVYTYFHFSLVSQVVKTAGSFI